MIIIPPAISKSEMFWECRTLVGVCLRRDILNA